MASSTLPEIASRSSVSRLQEEIDSGRDLEERDQRGRTAVFRCARIGREEHLRILLRANGNPNAEDALDERPLHAAARNGHIGCIKLLIGAGAAIDYCSSPDKTRYSESALCTAVRKSPEAAMELLSQGANPNAGTSANRYPLRVAVCDSSDPSIASELIAKGADLEAKDEFGRSALYHAVQHGTVAQIKTLIKAGADANSVDSDGDPIVCAAVLSSRRDPEASLLALLSGRPDLSLVSPRWNKTALELALHVKRDEMAEILRSAGSPEPAANSSGIEAVLEDEGGDDNEVVGEGVLSGLKLSFASAPRVKPAQSDKEIARRVANSTPSLLKNCGWTSSPGHWLLLDGSKRTKGCVLSRLAYFVRNFNNAYAGEELKDGPKLLGESHQAAVDRFVDEGLIKELDLCESILRTSSAADLKATAEANGLTAGGTKANLLERLIDALGLERLSIELPPDTFYVITEEGLAQLANREAMLAAAEDKLRKQLLALLLDREMEWATHIARDICHLQNYSPFLKADKLADRLAQRLANARAVMGVEEGIVQAMCSKGGADLRLIAAGSLLTENWKSGWEQWGAGIQVPHDEMGQPYSPLRFGELLVRIAIATRR